MKIKSGKVILRLNGRALMVEQEVMTDGNNQPVIVNGVPQMIGGREMLVGDVIASILTTKKVEQFNTLKAYALAQRFYGSILTDLDDSDYSSLRETVEKNDQYIPLVLAQVLQALIEAKRRARHRRRRGSSGSGRLAGMTFLQLPLDLAPYIIYTKQVFNGKSRKITGLP